MTNSWSDIGNATLVVAWGANPAENHPACMAHINRAKRAPGLPHDYNPTNPDLTVMKPAAKMISIDPRYTRTAMQADNYVRIRPGTDLAFGNAVMNYIINNIADDATDVKKKYSTHFERFLNQAQSHSLIPDGLSGANNITEKTEPDRSKYTDARLIVNAAGTDYERCNTSAITTKDAFEPCVIYDAPAVEPDSSKAYKMWYRNQNIVAPDNDKAHLMYSTSADGKTWTTPGVATDYLVSAGNAPFVWREADALYMVNNNGGRRIVLYKSVNGAAQGTAWTYVADLLNTDALDGGATFTDTDPTTPMTVFKFDKPSVLKEIGPGPTFTPFYKLYLQGREDSSIPGYKYRIYQTGTTTLAPSAWVSGTFAVATLPALTAAGGTDWDAMRVFAPVVVKMPTSGKYYMLYGGYDADGVPMKIGMARSSDGIAWTRMSPNDKLGFTDAGSPVAYGIGRPTVALVGNTFHLWHHDEVQNLYKGYWSPFSGLPVAAADITDPNCVWQKLKTHVAPYTEAEAAAICGCKATDVALVANALIENSRMASYTGIGTADPKNSLENRPYSADYRAATFLYAMGITQHTVGSQNIKMFANLQTILGNMGRCGGGINALRGIHNVQGSTDMGVLYNYIPGYTSNPTVSTTADLGAVTHSADAFGKYMDGLWGSKMSGGVAHYDDAFSRATYAFPKSTGYGTDRDLAAFNLQSKGFYNMTMHWFAPAYTTPAYPTAATPTNTVDFISDATAPNGGIPAIADRRNAVNAVYDLWPKGNVDDHITMYRKMIAGTTTACYCLGMNPAVTEPNQKAVRDALKALDLLVVEDIFETETAKVRRKAGAVTYLLPAASHVEQAGMAVNSGRVLQWRYEALKPRGNCKTDNEYLLTLAKKLDDKGAFSHIEAVWTTAAGPGGLGWKKATGAEVFTIAQFPNQGIFVSVYDSLYGRQYGWTPGNPALASTFAAATESPILQHEGPIKSGDMTGAEYVAEKVYRQMCTSVANAGGGTVWIYHQAYDSGNKAVSPGDNSGDNTNKNARYAGFTTRLGEMYTAWGIANRSKSRDLSDPYGTYGLHKWGYSWLVNRRTLYNNNAGTATYATGATAAAGPGLLYDITNEVPGDQTDGFQGPDKCVRLFAQPSTQTSVMPYAHNNYRKHHSLKDKPFGATAGVHSLPGRFPAHTEPYESPNTTAVAKYGRNSISGTSLDLIPGAGADLTYSPIGAVTKFPLILTTIRCVEHFQGGPITRNNSWNVEAEPVPWIEINSVDARNYGIVDGQMVNVITARSNSTTQQEGRTDVPAGWAKGFKARVGTGLQGNQRVAKGVVAIPWHWGDRGLSTGSRANDLCIDAGDANMMIPEYKACLCEITTDLSKTPETL